MSGATEDEQPVDLFESAQFYLSQRVGLLQPSDALLDQPSPAQADSVPSVPCRPAIQSAFATVFVLGDVWRDVQLACGADEIVLVVGLVGAQNDAACAL